MSFSLFNNRPDPVQDLLIAYADALAAGSVDRSRLLAEYDEQTISQAEDLLNLVERVSHVLVRVTPSEAFVNELRRCLAEPDAYAQETWWDWIRQLPQPVQWAAGIGGAATLTAGVAGVVYFARRPVMDVLSGWRSRWTATA